MSGDGTGDAISLGKDLVHVEVGTLVDDDRPGNEIERKLSPLEQGKREAIQLITDPSRKVKELIPLALSLAKTGFTEQAREARLEVEGVIRGKRPADTARGETEGTEMSLLNRDDELTAWMGIVRIEHALGNEEEAMQALDGAWKMLVSTGDQRWQHPADIQHGAGIILDTAMAVGAYDTALNLLASDIPPSRYRKENDLQAWINSSRLEVAEALLREGRRDEARVVIEQTRHALDSYWDKYVGKHLSELQLEMDDLEGAQETALKGWGLDEFLIAMIKHKSPYIDEALALEEKYKAGYGLPDIAKALIEIGQTERAMQEMKKKHPELTQQIVFIKDLIRKFIDDMRTYAKGKNTDDRDRAEKYATQEEAARQGAEAALGKAEELIGEEDDSLKRASYLVMLAPQYRHLGQSYKSREIITLALPLLREASNQDEALEERVMGGLYSEVKGLDIDDENNRDLIREVADFFMQKKDGERALGLLKKLSGEDKE